MKKSIAIVGATEKSGIQLAERIAKSDYRLLLISDKLPALASVYRQLSDKYPLTEINFLECVKDGCWEADIIILAVPEEQEIEVARLMKEVAVQKIVISNSMNLQQWNRLEDLLPNSRLVWINAYPLTNKIIVYENHHKESVAEVVCLFNNTGFVTEIVNFPIEVNHFLTQK